MQTPQPEEILEGITQILADVLNVPADSITAESRIADIAQVESIKLLRVAGKIERRFGVELDNEAVFKDGTLRDLVDQVAALKAEAA